MRRLFRILPLIVLLASKALFSGIDPSVRVVQPPRKLAEGGSYEYTVRFAVAGTPDGWIIQRLTTIPEVTDCRSHPRKPRNHKIDWWEAWRVRKGKVYVGGTSTPDSRDFFRTVSEDPLSAGRLKVFGFVTFYKNYKLTLPPWEHNTLAGALPILRTPPAGWDHQEGNVHDLEISFDFCNIPPTSSAHAIPGAKEPVLRAASAPAPSSNIVCQRFDTEVPTATAASKAGPAGNVVWQRLDRMQAWSSPSHLTPQKQIENLALLEPLSRIGLRTLRRQLSEYVAAHDNSIDDMSKVYILNRYLFNVPVQEPTSNSESFGGWAGVPMTEHSINPLWPLSLSKQGKLQITGVFSGYYGHVYLALEEFDYFAAKYGLRDR